MEEAGRKQLAFVLRVWLEPGEETRRWRGVVQALDGERRRYFSELSDAVDFVRASMKGEEA